MFKKILPLFLAFLLLFTLVACQGEEPIEPDPGTEPTTPTDPAPDDPEVFAVNSGSIPGTDITWEVTNERILYIKGSGALPDYDMPNDTPWYEHTGTTSTDRSDKDGGSLLVTKVVIEEGITVLSENAFRDFRPLTTVVLSSTVQQISFKCFAECPNLKTVIGGSGLTLIEAEAFRGCASLESFELSPALTKVEDSAFGDIIPTGTSRKLAIRVLGTEAAWQTAFDGMDIGLDNKALLEATFTYSEAE